MVYTCLTSMAHIMGKQSLHSTHLTRVWWYICRMTVLMTFRGQTLNSECHLDISAELLLYINRIFTLYTQARWSICVTIKALGNLTNFCFKETVTNLHPSLWRNWWESFCQMTIFLGLLLQQFTIHLHNWLFSNCS